MKEQSVTSPLPLCPRVCVCVSGTQAHTPLPQMTHFSGGHIRSHSAATVHHQLHEKDSEPLRTVVIKVGLGQTEMYGEVTGPWRECEEGGDRCCPLSSDWNMGKRVFFPP